MPLPADRCRRPFPKAQPPESLPRGAARAVARGANDETRLVWCAGRAFSVRPYRWRRCALLPVMSPAHQGEDGAPIPSRTRARPLLSVFFLHLFTHMPQNSDSQINRGEGFAQNPPHFAFSSGLFLRQSAVFQRFAPYHHKKMRNSINVCDRRNHCAVCFFRARVRSAPQRTNLSFPADCKSHFLPVGAHPNMVASLNYSSKRGEAVVTVLPHGRTRKREPQSVKSSHLSNYGSTLCVIRVKR